MPKAHEERTQAPSMEETQAAEGHEIPAVEDPSATLPADGPPAPSVDATLAAGTPPKGSSKLLPDVGESIGRYVVLSKLGAGAMGVVLAAYDPELDRRIAVKLLKLQSRGEAARQRLQREAQALAKLNHPNVVTVYDVGEHRDQVYVAMEFVEGRTLGDWLETKRSWQDVLEVFRAAGRGLSAAHEAGLVHRDFKPDNVMLGEDGRVRVMDFGLARAGDAEDTAPVDVSELESGGSTTLDAALTQTGAVLGTPAYMAPEQFAGTDVTARSDQFGFCVAMYQALYGGRPFRGSSIAELAYAVQQGELVETPSGKRVPRWLHLAVVRGLAADPERRFPDMRSLIDELDAGTQRRRRRATFSSLAGVGLLGAAALGAVELDERRKIAACEASGAAIDDEWNAETRERVRTNLLATKAPFANSTVEHVLPWLDQQAQALRTVSTATCLATRVEQTRTEADLARAEWCLEDRRIEFMAIVDEMTDPDFSDMVGAVEAATELGAVEPCGELRARADDSLPPPDVHDDVREVRRELGRVGAEYALGDMGRGLEMAKAAFERAEAIDWPPLVAHARYEVGAGHLFQGEFDVAEAELERTYFEAAKHSVPEVAYSAALQLTKTVGVELGRHDEGKRWASLADVERLRIGGDTRLREAKLLAMLVLVLVEKGELDEAERLGERVLMLRQETVDENHPLMAQALDAMSTVKFAQRDYDAAAELEERAVEILTKALGEDHPDVGQVTTSLGTVLDNQGRSDEAVVLLRRGLAIREAALRPDHPELAYNHYNLGMILGRTGDVDGQIEHVERALKLFEASVPGDHPRTAFIMANLAVAYQDAGRMEEAESLTREALAMQERTLPPDHQDIAASLDKLGTFAADRAAFDEALQFHERALTIYQSVFGDDHIAVASTHEYLARTHMALDDYEAAARHIGRAVALQKDHLEPDDPQKIRPLAVFVQVALHEGRDDEAIEAARRAVELSEAEDTEPLSRGEARFVLARALVASGGDRVRATKLGLEARAAFEEAGPVGRHLAKEVADWLDG